MKVSKKVAGLTMAGAAATGTAIAVVGSAASTPPTGNVSEQRPYAAPQARQSGTGQITGPRVDADRGRRRPTVIRLTSRFSVVHLRMGRSLAVTRKIGKKWRVIGTLRAGDTHVLGAQVPVRHPTTVIAVAGRQKVRLVVPPRAVVVVADNGRIGVVSARHLMAIKQPTAATSTPSPARPPMTTAPAPTGSQSPVVGGLEGRTSPKW